MPQIPYWLVPAIVVIYLAVRHVGSEEASKHSKRLVCGLTAGSMLIHRLEPRLSVLAILIQVGICFYVFYYRTIMELVEDDSLKGSSLLSQGKKDQPNDKSKASS
jgi:hypothetical protein